MANAVLAAQPYCYTQAESNYALKSLCERMVNVALMIARTVKFILFIAPSFIYHLVHPHPAYCNPAEQREWREDNEGLYVFISGLKSHPIWAEGHRSRLEREQPNMEVRIPSIPHNGDCSLEEAAQPIVEMIRDYIQQNPGKPICLIGTSNGGRIAAKVETALRGEGAPIRVSALAGVFFGSQRMDRLAHWHIADYLFNPAVVQELQTGSEVSIALIEAMRAETEDPRAYEFFASANDEFIPNFSSCLPIFGRGETFRVVEGENHFSITHSARREQLNNARRWMEENRVVEV